jgi:thioredoxin 1
VNVIDLNEANFEQKITEGGIVLVECWAEWCKACQTFAPIYEKVAANFPDHTFGKIDSQEESDLIDKLGVELIPSLMLYREGILLFQQPGYYEEKQLRSIIHQAEALDMDLVRADIAAEEEKRRGEIH